ncbi:uncharacterized protein C8orf88 homolog isoform X2 [Pleurodeles waltl]|uniref:uncharacterized protein C8orf88 homolog isoform X2 n=1 Tax=Pleurodeles waltl TaxID=8319 RepID=UPI00370939D6
MNKLMENKKMIRKSLQPARPLRRLSPTSSTSTFTVNFNAEFPCSCPLNLPTEVNWWWNCNNSDYSTDNEDMNSNKFHDPESKDSAFAALQTNNTLVTSSIWSGENTYSENSNERITYSRDFLMKLSSLSISRKKPEFLPDHPIVLQDPIKDMEIMEPVDQEEEEDKHLYKTGVWLSPNYQERRALSTM